MAINITRDILALMQSIVEMSRDDIQQDEMFLQFSHYSLSDHTYSMKFNEVFPACSFIDWERFKHIHFRHCTLVHETSTVYFESMTELFHGIHELYCFALQSGTTDDITLMCEIIAKCLDKIHLCLDEDDVMDDLSAFRL